MRVSRVAAAAQQLGLQPNDVIASAARLECEEADTTVGRDDVTQRIAGGFGDRKNIDEEMSAGCRSQVGIQDQAAAAQQVYLKGYGARMIARKVSRLCDRQCNERRRLQRSGGGAQPLAAERGLMQARFLQRVRVRCVRRGRLWCADKGNVRAGSECRSAENEDEAWHGEKVTTAPSSLDAVVTNGSPVSAGSGGNRLTRLHRRILDPQLLEVRLVLRRIVVVLPHLRPVVRHDVLVQPDRPAGPTAR